MSDDITDDCFAFLDIDDLVNEPNQTSSVSLNKKQQNRTEIDKPGILHFTAEELIKTNAELTRRFNNRTKELDRTLKKLLDVGKERQRFEKLYTTVQKELGPLKEKIEELSKEKQRNDPLIKALSDKVEALETHNEELQQAKTEWECKKKSPVCTQKTRNAENKELAISKEIIEELQNEIKELQRFVATHEPYVAQMDKEKAELLHKVQELTIHIQNTKGNTQLVEEEIHKVKENEKKLQVLLEKAMVEVKNLKLRNNGYSVPSKEDSSIKQDYKVTELMEKLEEAEGAQRKAEEDKRKAEAERTKLENECQSVIDGFETDIVELEQQRRIAEKQLIDLQKKQSVGGPASSNEYSRSVEETGPSLIASAFRLNTIPSFDSDRMAKCIAEFRNDYHNMIAVSPLSESSEEVSNPALEMFVDSDLDPCASIDSELDDHNVAPHKRKAFNKLEATPVHLKGFNDDTVAGPNTCNAHDDTHLFTSFRIFDKDTSQSESSHTYKDIPQNFEVRSVCEDSLQSKLPHRHRGTPQCELFNIHKDTSPFGKPEHVNDPDIEMFSKDVNNVDRKILPSGTCDTPEISLGSESLDPIEVTSLSESNFSKNKTFTNVTKTAKNIYSILPTENKLNLSQSVAQTDPLSQKKNFCPVLEHECSKSFMLDAIITNPSDSESIVTETNGSMSKLNSDACEDRNEAILNDDVAATVTVEENLRGKSYQRRSFHLDDLYNFFPNKCGSLSSTYNSLKSDEIGHGGSLENDVRPKCALRRNKSFHLESISWIKSPVIKELPALESSTNVCQNSSNSQTLKNSKSEITKQGGLREITQFVKERRRWKSTSNVNAKTWHKDMCSLQSLKKSQLEMNGVKRDSLHEDDCNMETLDENELKVNDVAKNSLVHHEIENVQILQEDNLKVNLASESESMSEIACGADTLQEGKLVHDSITETDSLHEEIPNSSTWQESKVMTSTSHTIANIGFEDVYHIQTSTKGKLKINGTAQMNNHPDIVVGESTWPNINIVETDSLHKDICDAQTISESEPNVVESSRTDSLYSVITNDYTLQRNNLLAATSDENINKCFPDIQTVMKSEMKNTDNIEIGSHLGIVNYEAMKESKLPDIRVVKTDSLHKEICDDQTFNKHKLDVTSNAEIDDLDSVNYEAMKESKLPDTKVVKTDSLHKKDVRNAQTLNESKLEAIGHSRSDNLYREINRAQTLQGNRVVFSKVKANMFLKDAEARIKSKLVDTGMTSRHLNNLDCKTSKASKLTNTRIEKIDLLCDKSQDRQCLKRKKSTDFSTETGCSINDAVDNSALNKIRLNALNSLQIIPLEPKTPAHRALKMKSKLNSTANPRGLLQDPCHTKIGKTKKAKTSCAARINTALAALRNTTKSSFGINMAKKKSCEKEQVHSQISNVTGIDNSSNNLNRKRNLPPTQSNCTNRTKKVKTKKEKKSKGAQDKNPSMVLRASYRQIKMNATSSKHPLEEALDVLEEIKFKRTQTDYNQFKHRFVNALKNPAIAQSSEEIVMVICKYLASSTRDPFSSFIKGNFESDCLVPRIELCIVDSLHTIGQKENDRFSSLINQFLLKIANYILEDEALPLKGLTAFCRAYGILSKLRIEINLQQRVLMVWELLKYLKDRRSEVFPFAAASILSTWLIAWHEKKGDDMELSKKFVLKAMLQPPAIHASQEVKNNWMTCLKTIKALFKTDIPMVQNTSLAELREAFEQMKKSTAKKNTLTRHVSDALSNVNTTDGSKIVSPQENSSDVDR